jgi:mannose-6-phosphate isomerase
MSRTFYKNIEDELTNLGFQIVDSNFEKPWGAYFCIDEIQVQYFSDKFFDGIDVDTLNIENKLSPKILIVKPNVRLSWQYHNRRAEIWQVYKGIVGVVKSDTDIENELKNYMPGDQIKLRQGERHRLIGLDDYAIVAEIWQHSLKDQPSDEADIVRVQDDFGR